MERIDRKQRKEYVGLFVLGRGETRDGRVVFERRHILINGPHISSQWRGVLEGQASAMKAKGQYAKVLALKTGRTVWGRDIPEDCISEIQVGQIQSRTS